MRRRRTLAAAGSLALLAIVVPLSSHEAARGAAAPAAAVAPPVRLSVPSVGIDATLVPLPSTPDGTVELPSDLAGAGWLMDGPKPGEPGAAVITAPGGRSLRAAWREVEVGDVIEVVTADGTVLGFLVEAVAHYPRSPAPTAVVFHPRQPMLRIVLADGASDSRTSDPGGDVVVFAALSVGTGD